MVQVFVLFIAWIVIWAGAVTLLGTGGGLLAVGGFLIHYWVIMVVNSYFAEVRKAKK